MKQIAQKLEVEITKAVSLIVAASHAAALAALDEAFGSRPQERRRRDTADSRPRGVAARRSSPAQRRSSAQIEALEEKLLQAVWTTPGESMSVLAAQVGATAAQLQVVVARLKASRRIKAVGERQFTRYFPVERSDDGVGEVVED
jgi:hypothetical protein